MEHADKSGRAEKGTQRRHLPNQPKRRACVQGMGFCGVCGGNGIPDVAVVVRRGNRPQMPGTIRVKVFRDRASGRRSPKPGARRIRSGMDALHLAHPAVLAGWVGTRLGDGREAKASRLDLGHCLGGICLVHGGVDCRRAVASDLPLGNVELTPCSAAKVVCGERRHGLGRSGGVLVDLASARALAKRAS